MSSNSREVVVAALAWRHARGLDDGGSGGRAQIVDEGGCHVVRRFADACSIWSVAIACYTHKVPVM